jgi:hypothetical protein
MKKNYRNIEIVGLIPGYPKGSIVRVETDSEGTPLSFFWRRCLKAAQRDDSCRIVLKKENEPKRNVLESLETRSHKRERSDT